MEEHVQPVKIEDEEAPSISKSGKRKRLKHLKKLREQMEFYFGDSNLAKDKFLTERLAEDPDESVEVDLFLKFNKIRALTSDVQDIVDALASSKILQISRDEKRVKRKKPVERTNFDDCTIYIERLPPQADQRWLKDVFTRFGKVARISIPHFKASGKIKGFAFLEFESPESVEKASKHFKTSSESGESDTGEESDDPKDKKGSGKTKKLQGHSKEHQFAKGKDGVPHQISRKRRRTESEGSERKRTESEGSERLGAHRRSLENADTNGKSTKQPEVDNKNEAVDTTRSASELDSCDEKSEAKSTGGKEHPETVELKSDAISPHKSGRKRKRRDTDTEGGPRKVKTEQTCGDVSVAAKPQVRISGSDSESKSGTDVKNKSGSKVKEHLKHSASEIKSEGAAMSGNADEKDQAATDITTKESETSDSNGSLSKRQKKRQHKKKNKSDDDKLHLRVLTKAEWKVYRNKYLNLQRASMVHVKKMLFIENQHSHFEEDEDIDDDNYEQSPIKEDKPHHAGGVEFQPGVIIKLKLPMPAENCLTLRKKVRSLADVSYVDATEGSSEVYVRCPNPEAVSNIIAEARFAELGDTEIIKDQEETSYWKKVSADRDAKLKNKIKHMKNKKRGRDKLMARAEKMMGMNTHVHFDD